MSAKKGAAPPTDPDARNELVVYATEDGRAQFYLRTEGGTVWLTQLELAELFQISVPNINIHIRNLLADGELSGDATIQENLIVRTEGRRSVQWTVKLYNLDLMLGVGYRVRSPRSGLRNRWERKHVDLPRQAVVACFATTDPVATIAKTATVGRPNSVVKESFTTAVLANLQGFLDSSIRGAK